MTQQLRLLASEAQRAGTATTLSLSRLELPDVKSLVVATSARGVTTPDGFDERLYKETEGLPFFVVEYLATLGASFGRRHRVVNPVGGAGPVALASRRVE